MAKKRQVALIIETSTVYGRDLLSGIVRYMRMHGDWAVFLEQRDLWERPPAWLNGWRGDGIISRATTPDLLQSIQTTGVPLVEVTDRRGDVGLPQIRSNDASIGVMEAEHLLERGFRRFGYCSYTGEAWATRRRDAFVETIEARGCGPVSLFESVWHGEDARSWEDEQRALLDWLKSIGPPFGVMACNDHRGQQVIEACLQADLAVPEQAAVIGVDNDELLCRVCSPPLSSVIPNAEAVGFLAAEMLAKLMRNEPVDAGPHLVEPYTVATRQSTDVVAIDDVNIAAALRYIRENACQGLTVAEVVRENGVSRSTLERQVRKYLGRTPQEEIRHVQVKRAKELLLTTDLPAEKIAAHCGFDHPEYLHVVFKRITGKTTREFRGQVGPS